jgi:ABC-type branched-subunit amino acid transport system ATPase component
MLKVKDLSFGFPGRVLLDDISVELRAGAITCLLGGNGSGKTTLFNLISGFLRPDSGSIRLGDTELTEREAFQISRLGIARTFQDLRLIGKLSVRDNILLALSKQPAERLGQALIPLGSGRQQAVDDCKRADVLLADYFLQEVAYQPASEISYGQQKLLTLACCAAMDASLLLLDEPAAGISADYREHIAERLFTFRAAGKTILLIEHQPEFLQSVGEQFLFLESGRLHAFDTLAALHAAPVSYDVLT